MQKKTNIPQPETFCPKNPEDWRHWLEENHQSAQSVWLVYLKKTAGTPNLSWSEAVTEALCFGWIDSTVKSLDAEKYIQFFTKRKPGSVWSKVNKDKVELLIAQGKMAEAGYKSIETAKQNGSWTSLDAVEALEIPEDLAQAFEAHPAVLDFYQSLSRSARKSILYWLALGKRAETRQKRIAEIVELGAQGKKPRHFWNG